MTKFTNALMRDCLNVGMSECDNALMNECVNERKQQQGMLLQEKRLVAASDMPSCSLAEPSCASAKRPRSLFHLPSSFFHLTSSLFLLLAFLFGVSNVAWGQNTKEFNSGGNGSWNVPATATKVKVHGVGGGGGGGSAKDGRWHWTAAGGGGGGAYDVNLVSVTLGSFSVHVANEVGSGTDGDYSSASYTSQGATTEVMHANGGSAGKNANYDGVCVEWNEKYVCDEWTSWLHITCKRGHYETDYSSCKTYNYPNQSALGGAGGTSSGRSGACAGGNGAKGDYVDGITSKGGGGGGSAGPGNFSPEHSSTSTQTQDGGNGYGKGGNGGTDGTGNDGVGYGGGGGGGSTIINTSFSGGKGHSGRVWIEYITATRTITHTCSGKNQGKIVITVSGVTKDLSIVSCKKDNQNYLGTPTISGNTITYSNLYEGEYEIVIKHNSGCECKVTATVNGLSPNFVINKPTVTNVACNGNATGEIALSTSNGVGTVTYCLSQDGTYQDSPLTGLTAGAYTVYAKDGNGCIVSRSVTITQPSALDLRVDSTEVTCYDMGKITVTVSGGSHPYSIQYRLQGSTDWSSTIPLNQAGTKTITGLGDLNTDKIYEVRVVDAHDCPKTDTITVPHLNNPIPQIVNIMETVCGGASFSITPSVTDPVNQVIPADIKYSWDGPENTGIAGETEQDDIHGSILNYGSNDLHVVYVVTPSVGVNCEGDTFRVEVVVSPGNASPANFTLPDLYTCPGKQNLELSTTFHDVISSFTAQWKFNGTAVGQSQTITTDNSSFSTGVDIENSPVDTIYNYSMVVTDITTGCPSTKTARIYVDLPEWEITDDDKRDTVTCIAEADVLPHKNPVVTMPVVDITCDNTTFHAKFDTVPLKIVSSMNECNTSVTYIYTYEADNGTTDTWRYTYYVKDTVKPVITTGYNTEVAVVNENCIFMVPDVTDSLRKSIYLNDNCTLLSELTLIQTPSAGSYIPQADTAKLVKINVTVVDKCDNRVTTTVPFVTIVPPRFNAVIDDAHLVNVTCKDSANGSVAVIASGGTGEGTYQYRWSNDAWSEDSTSASISGLSAGYYMVTVTDTNGCQMTDIVTITEPTKVSGAIALTNNPICLGETAIIVGQGTGGDNTSYTYQWGGAATGTQFATSLTPTVAGSYTITLNVKDDNNCPADEVSATLTVNALPVVSIIPSDTLICAGSEVVLKAVVDGEMGEDIDPNNYSLTWSPSDGENYHEGVDTTVTNAGIYTVTVANASNCVSTATATVSTYPAVELAFGATATPVQTICSGIDITPIEIVYDNADIDITWDNEPNGIYLQGNYLMGTTENETSQAVTYQYTITAVSDQDTLEGEHPVCSRQYIQGSITVRPLPKVTLVSGTLDTTVCSGEAIGNVVFSNTNSSLSIAWTDDNNNNGNLVWNANTKTLSGTPVLTSETTPTTYHYTVTATSTFEGNPVCAPATMSGDITVNPLVNLTVGTNTDQTRCLGDSIETISVTHDVYSRVTVTELPSGVLYRGDSISGTPLQTGTFNYTIKAESQFAHACASKTATGTITVNPLVSLSPASDASPTTCAGVAMNTISINYANAELSIEWTDDNDQTITQPEGIDTNKTAATYTILGTPTTAGVYHYKVKATSTHACASDSLEGTVTVNPKPVLTISQNTTQTVCAGEAIETISISYPNTNITEPNLSSYGLTFEANNTNHTATITGTPTRTAIFNLTASNSCGSVDSTITITVNPLPTISITNAVDTVCQNENIVPMIVSVANATVDSATIAEALPAGLLYSSSTGRITGAPTAEVNSVTTYSVTVTAYSTLTGRNGSCGTMDSTIRITVNPLVKLTVTNDEETICLGESIAPIVIDYSNATISYDPTLDASLTATSTTGRETITGAPTSAGTYNYTVSAQSTYNCPTVNKNISVRVNDTLPLTIIGADSVCLNSDASLSNKVLTLSTNNVLGCTYSWELDGGEFVGDNNDTYTINAKWSTAGTKIVRVTVNNGNCLSHKSDTITVNSLPAVEITANGALTNVCPRASNVVLTATGSAGSGSGYSYEWTGDLAVSTTTGEVTIPTLYCDTNYTVGVTVTDSKGCSVASENTTINVMDNTAPTITNVINLAAQVTNGNCAFKIPDFASSWTATDDCSSYEQLQWGFHQEPAAFSLYYQADTVQNIPVELTITDACGNAAVDTVYVIIPRKMTVSVATPADICLGDTATLTAEVHYQQGSGAITYEWIPTIGLDVSEAASAEVHAFPSATQTYYVNATDGNGCVARANVTVTVKTAPEAFTFDCPENLQYEKGLILEISRPLETGETVAWTTSDENVIAIAENSSNPTQIEIKGRTADLAATITAEITDTTKPAGCNTSSYYCKIDVVERAISMDCPDDLSKVYDAIPLTADENDIHTYYIELDNSHTPVSATLKYTMSKDNGEHWGDTTNTIPRIENVFDGPVLVKVIAYPDDHNYATQSCRYSMSITPKQVDVTVNDCKSYDESLLVTQMTSNTAVSVPVDALLNNAAFVAGSITTTGADGGTYLMSDGTSQISEDFVVKSGNDTVTANYDFTVNATQTIMRARINGVPAANDCPKPDGEYYELSAELVNLTGADSYSWNVKRDGNNWRTGDQDTIHITSDGKCHVYEVTLTIGKGTCNSNVVSATITAEDEERPVIIVLSDSVPAVRKGNCTYAIPLMTTNGEYVDASDNCSPLDSLKITQDKTGFITTDTMVTVYVEDLCGRRHSAQIKVLVPKDLALHDYTSTYVTCNGTATGTVTIEAATGGTPDYTYSIGNRPASESRNFIELLAGEYTVTATDANGCTATMTVTVDEPDALVVGYYYATPATCANNDGTISITGTHGGVAYANNIGYLYRLTLGTTFERNSFGTTSATTIFNNLPKGTYTLTVTDANGCEQSQEITVERTSDLNVVLPDSLSICSGGTVVITPESIDPISYTPNVRYDWTCEGRNGGNEVTVIRDEDVELGSGVTEPVVLTYYVTAKNENCILPLDSVKVTVNPTVKINTQPYEFCYNSNGPVEIETGFENVSLAANRYTLSGSINGTNLFTNGVITNGSATFMTTLANMSCGNDYPYTITYTDDAGCRATSENIVHVGVVGDIEFSTNVAVEDTVECESEAVAAGETDSRIVLPQATNGCGDDITSDYELVQPIIRNINSNGESTVAYTYRYHDCDGTTKDWTFTYHILRTTAPSEYVAAGGTAVPTTAMVEKTADAIAPVFLPVVKNVCGNTLSNPEPVIETTDNVCENTRTYTYIYRDSVGCYKDSVNSVFVWTFTYTIKDTTAPEINTLALNMNRRLTASNCEFSIPNLTEDVRLVSIDNIVEKSHLIINQSPVIGTPVELRDTVYIIPVSVTVTDSCDNDSTVVINLTVPARLQLDTVYTNNVQCNNCGRYGLKGSFQVEAIGGTPAYSYTYDGNAFNGTATDLCFTNGNDTTQTYHVEVVDANQCQASLDVVITKPTILDFATFPHDTVLCCEDGKDYAFYECPAPTLTTYANNPTITVYVSGALDSLPADGHYPVGTTTIQYRVSERRFCRPSVTPRTYTVTVLALTTITTEGGDANQELCSGNEIDTITITSYHAANIEKTGNLPAEFYTITTIDDTTKKVVISGIPSVTENTSYNYSFTFSSEALPNQSEPCNQEVFSGTITVKPAPTATLTVNSNETCAGNNASVTINVSGGTPQSVFGTDFYQYTYYSVSTGQPTPFTINTLHHGDFTLTVTDLLNCSVEVSTEILLNSPYNGITLSDVTIDPLCSGQSFNHAIPSNMPTNMGGFSTTYSWDAPVNANISSGLAAGDAETDVYGNHLTNNTTETQMVTYQVTPLTGDACYGNPYNVNVSVYPKFNLTETSPDAIYCKEDNNVTALAVSVVGSGSYTYQWYQNDVAINGATSASYTPSTAEAGSFVYKVKVSDQTCNEDSTITVANITVNDYDTPSITGENEICINNSTTANELSLSTQTGMSNYVWTVDGGTITEGEGTASIKLQWASAGTKTVSVNFTNASGCMSPSATTKTITVYALTVPTLSGGEVCINNSEANASLNLTTQSGMSNYVWNLGEGGSTSGSGNAIEAQWSSVGTKTVSVSFEDAHHCTTTSSPVSVQVYPKPLVQVTVANSQCYNTADGFITVNLMNGTPTYTVAWNDNSVNTNGSTSSLPNGEYTINNLADGNYNIAVTDSKGCKMTTTQAVEQIAQTLTITSASHTWDYDGTDHSDASYTISFGNESYTISAENAAAGHSLQNGDVVTATVTGSIYQADTVDNTIANVKVMRGNVDVSCYYNIDKQEGKLIVKRVTVTVAAEAKTKVYGNSDPTLTATVSGLIAGEPISVIDYSLSRVAGESVGSYTITPAGAAEQGNYHVEYTTNTLTITPLTVNVAITGNTDMVAYTGSVQSVNGFTAVADNSSYDVTNVSGSASTSGSAVGVYPMNLSAANFTNGDANYNVNFSIAADGWLEIVPAGTVIVTISGHQAVVDYNGDEHSVSGYDVSIWVPQGSDPYTTDDFEFSGNATASRTAVGTSNMGLDANQFTNLNSAFTNVRFNVTDGYLTVNKANVEVFVTGNTDINEYLGVEQSVTGYAINTNSNIYNIQNSVVFNGNATASGTAVGIYNMGLSANQFANNNGNFNVSFNVTDGWLEIVKAGIVIVEIVGHQDTVDYNGTLQTVTGWSIDTVKGRYVESGEPYANHYPASASDIQFNGNATASRTDVGTTMMGLRADDFVNTNESFKVRFHVTDGFLTVKPLDVTVAIKGNRDTANYDGNAHEVSGYIATASSPLYKVSGNTTDFVFSGNAVASRTEVGTTYMGLAAEQFTNTNSNFGTVTFNITDGDQTIAPATITIKADNKTKVYDNNASTDPELTATVTGVPANGVAPVYSLNRVAGQNVGEYAITVTAEAASNPNYNVTVEGGTFSITPAAITIKADNKTKVYDNTASTDPALTATVTGLPANGVAPVYSLNRAAGQNVGEYAITVTAEATSNPNYNVTVESGTFSITPAAVTIKADNKTKVYDNTASTDPALTATVTGVPANGVAPVYSLNRAAGQNVGDYTITVTAAATSNPNYNVTVESGTFSITPAAITIKADNKTKVYDNIASTDPALTATVTGVPANGVAPVYSLNRAAGQNVGDYAITVTAVATSNPNYNVTVEGGTFSITPAAITIKADNKTKVYDNTASTDPALTATVTGVPANGVAPVYSLSRVTGQNVGDYAITVNAVATSNPNYTVTAQGGTFSITPATLTVNVTGHSATVSYNGTTQNVSGYDLSCTSSLYNPAKVVYSGNAVASGMNAGTYTMGLTANQFSYNDNNFTNVTFNIVDGQLVINKINATVKLHGNTDTASFDGQAHTVTGYTVDEISTPLYTANDFGLATGMEASASRTAVGTTTMGLTAASFVNNSNNFGTVTFQVTDGWQTVIPTTNEVVVKIAGNIDTSEYDGAAHTVTGYEVTAIEIAGQATTLYTVNDFSKPAQTATVATATRSELGTTSMTLSAADFANTNANFSTVTFQVTPGAQTIIPSTAEVVVKVKCNSQTNEYDGNAHTVTGYQVTAIEIAGQSTTLYTVNDFTKPSQTATVATATRTDAGTTNMTLSAADFVNTNSHFTNVTFNIIAGGQTITPLSTLVTVTVVGNNHSDYYDGTAHSISGYNITSISNSMYTVNDFTKPAQTATVATATRTDAGTELMTLSAADFVNTNGNFGSVTFQVTPGYQTIMPINAIVTVVGANNTITYDGAVHTVDGYTATANTPLYDVNNSISFSGTASASRSSVGTTYMQLNANQFSNTNSNFSTVTFNVTDGYQTITAVDEVVVTITGHHNTTTFDGQSHSVSGYEVSFSNPLYSVADFDFNGNASASRTEAGTTNMGLDASQFVNHNTDFAHVTFNVTDGYQTISPLNVAVEIVGNHNTASYDGQAHTVSGYTANTINPLYNVTNSISFSGTASVSRTDAGTSYMGLDALHFTNTNSNFNVTFTVIDGYQTINPINVTVNVVGNHNSTVYDGNAHTVNGYTATATNTLYDVNSSISFSGTASASRTDVGTTNMGLRANQFANTNSNFGTVTFNVTDGYQTITPLDVIVTVVGAYDTVEYDGSQHTVSGFTATANTPLFDASTVYYTFMGISYTPSASRTDVGTTTTNLYASRFRHNNQSSNFGTVSYQVTNGCYITIIPRPVTVTIVGNHDSTVYDGNSHNVSNYTISANVSQYRVTGGNSADYRFNGTASASRTNAGTTYMGLNASQFTNRNNNYDATFEVTDGYQTITPLDVTVDIVGNHNTTNYDGNAHTVSGYTATPSSSLYNVTTSIHFSGTASATRTDAGTTYMGLDALHFSNTNINFGTVTFNVTDGYQTINPINVNVTIVGNHSSEVYDGNEHVVSGYTATASSNLYDVAHDFTFSGVDTARRTVVGTTNMGLAAAQFANTNSNFATVNFNVTDGYQTITPLDVIVTIEGNKDTAAYDGAEHTVTGYVASANTPLYDVAHDFNFSGNASASRTEKGTTPMNLTAGQFTNTNTNFGTVTFNINDGYQMIAPVNVIVTVVGNKDTVEYDGAEHGVSGYTITASNPLYSVASNVSFSGSATAASTAAGTTYMGLTAAQFTDSGNANFDTVTFAVTDGWLTITPKTGVVVTITEHADTAMYDGHPHSVSGYDMTVNDVLYSLSNVSHSYSTADTIMTATLAGNHPSTLTPEMFSNTNPNFDTVTFDIVRRGMNITKNNKAIVITSGNSVFDYDGQPHTYPSYTASYDGVELSRLASDSTKFELPTGDVLSVTNAAQITYYVDDFSHNNTFSYEIENGDSYDAAAVSSNYGTISINAMSYPLKIESKGASYTYDGYAHFYKQYRVTFAGDTIPAANIEHDTVFTLPTGDRLTITSAPGIRYVGTMANTFTYTLEHDIQYIGVRDTVVDTLRMAPNPAVITITANSASKLFDGTPLTAPGYTYTPAGTIAQGDSLVVVTSGSITNVGQTENVVVDYKVYRNEGLNSLMLRGLRSLTATPPAGYTKDVTDCYTFATSTVNGVLSVYETLEVTANVTSEPLCPGVDEGSVTITMAGGAIPEYDYNIVGINTADVYAGTCDGTLNLSSLKIDVYTVTVTESLGNTASINFEIAARPVISLANSTLTCPAMVDDTIRGSGCRKLIVDLGTPTFTTTTGIPMSEITITNNAPADHLYPVGETVVKWVAKSLCGDSISCEQVVKVSFMECPNAVDYEGNSYPSVRLGSGCRCWTTENLKSTLYSDGRPVEDVMDYYSDEYPNTTENVSIFGHLYSWYAAADTSVHTVAEIEDLYAHGQRVQGVCPAGWELPSDEDFEELNAYPIYDLKSTQYWINGDQNTNATGFNALPGGMFNCSNNRYENMMGNAYYWTCHPVYDLSSGAMVDYVCERLLVTPAVMRCNGFSIRCVLIEE